MTPDDDQQEMWRITAVKHGLSQPFLLHELLAIAALHMAICYPDKEDLYTRRATELQNEATRLFNEVEVTDESNCIAVLLFSSLLGVHLLADRSRTRGLGSGDYLDHMLGCIGLLRSVMKLTLRQWTPFFMTSDIKPLMRNPNPRPPYDGIPIEARALDDLIQESDLGRSSVEAYNGAIDRLYWLLALTEVPTTLHGTARYAIGWPVQLPDEYILLLNQRRPEALIILAYYGVVMHFYREAWTIGDTGACLIRAVNAQVGSFWARWLEWPLRVIEAS